MSPAGRATPRSAPRRPAVLVGPELTPELFAEGRRLRAFSGEYLTACRQD